VDTAIALDHSAVPVDATSAVPIGDATPAKLIRDPKLTVQLSEREFKNALRKKARKAEKSTHPS
jgi:hypothetical protein